MTRRRLLWGFLIATALVAVTVAVLLILIWHEPEVYTKAAVAPGPERQRLSGEFQTEFFEFLSRILSNEAKWDAEFSEQQINSYCQEDFIRSGAQAKTLPTGTSDPRVSIEKDRLRLAFRYGSGLWSTIVSIDSRVWIAGKEPNVVAIEIQALRAGALPIAAQILIERLTEMARMHRVDITWYRHQGNPVALVRFRSEQARPTVRLQSLELDRGKITVSGGALETTPLKTPLP